MRTGRSIKNIVVAVMLGAVLILINFIAQKFLIETLGIEYAGLNSLFTNMVSMLAVAELGLGAAIIYHLYKPLHEKDFEKVSSIMLFYKRGYRLIALAIVVIGSLFIPFLHLVVGEVQIPVSVTAVYLLFIGNSAISYLLSYKRSILYADQKNYVINIVHLTILMILNGLQIFVLVLTQNYYLYLVLKLVFTVIENYILNLIVDKQYSLNSRAESINKELRTDIFTKIKGLVFHKVGSFLVLGSTSVIISTTLGLTAVGFYANYLIIQTAVTSLFSQVSTAIKASVGNLLVDIGGAKSLAVFSKLQFANQALSVVSTSVFLIASSSFVALWLGSDFVFDIGVTIALALNIYLILTRSVLANFKEAAGIFYEDRYVPIIESIINIVMSLVLIHFMGIAGAFIGTALSSLALHAYSYPKYVYKGILGRTYREYFLHVLKNLMIAVVAIGFAYGTSILIQVDSILLQLVLDVIVAITIPALVFWLIYRKNIEYLYFRNLFLSAFKRNRKTKK